MAGDKNSATSRASSSSPLSPATRPPARASHNICYYEPKKSHPPEAATAEAKKSAECETEDINKSADAFITRFKQQLQLQRLESIENYRQMLARGA